MAIKFKILEEYELQELEDQMNKYSNEEGLTAEQIIKIYYNRTFVGTTSVEQVDKVRGDDDELGKAEPIIANSALIVVSTPEDTEKKIELLQQDTSAKSMELLIEIINKAGDLISKYRAQRANIEPPTMMVGESKAALRAGVETMHLAKTDAPPMSIEEIGSYTDIVESWKNTAVVVIDDILAYYFGPKPNPKIPRDERYREYMGEGAIVNTVYKYFNTKCLESTEGKIGISDSWIKYMVHAKIEQIQGGCYDFVDEFKSKYTQRVLLSSSSSSSSS